MALSLFHLHGDLKDLRIPRLLAALREDDFTGVFQATTRPPGSEAGAAGEELNETTREVHFADGHIAWAISTDREESLKSYLLRNGALTEAQWADAELRARDATLRDALTGLGFVSPRELMQIEKGRAEEIVQALFAEREGEYRVRERQLAPGTPDLGIDPRPLILKGVLELGDRALVLDEIGTLDTVFVVKRSVLEEPGLTLPGEFQSVLRHIDGKRSVAQVCALTSLPDYFTSSVIAALSMVGAVRKNYAKTPPRSRAEIVKGADVAPAPRPVATPADDASPASAEAQLDLPPIATTPFPGEGPVTPIASEEPDASLQEAAVSPEPPADARPPRATRARGPAGSGSAPPREEAPSHVEPRAVKPAAAARSRPDAVGAGPETLPLILREERRPETFTPSAYDDDGPDDTSRPWFLIGGAVAVGLAALFLILMAQGPGDAGEIEQPLPVATATDGGGAASATDSPEYTDTSEEPDSATAVGEAAVPDTPTGAGDSAGKGVAAPSASSMLESEPSSPAGGHTALVRGDYRTAARQFGREVSAGSGDYTIQLLTACQDQTVKRAVETAGASPQVFILSTIVEGRNCYRVYWGRYPTQRKAQEALRHDVPATFRKQRSQPRITRLAGS